MVFILEDDSTYQALFTEKLQERGITVKGFDTVPEFIVNVHLEAMDRTAPTVALIDLRLYETYPQDQRYQGYLAARILKAHFPDIFCICISMEGVPVYLQEFFDAIFRKYDIEDEEKLQKLITLIKKQEE